MFALTLSVPPTAWTTAAERLQALKTDDRRPRRAQWPPAASSSCSMPSRPTSQERRPAGRPNGQGGEDGGGGGKGGGGDGILRGPLKMLKSLQQEINERTEYSTN